MMALSPVGGCISLRVSWRSSMSTSFAKWLRFYFLDCWLVRFSKYKIGCNLHTIQDMGADTLWRFGSCWYERDQFQFFLDSEISIAVLMNTGVELWTSIERIILHSLRNAGGNLSPLIYAIVSNSLSNACNLYIFFFL